MVIVVFDTSIWSQAHPAGESPWIDRGTRGSLACAGESSLPVGDRDAASFAAEPDAPPILPFTTDHLALRRAIADAQSSSGIADVPRALEMGKAALAGSSRGLLVYVGPGIVDEKQARGLDEFRAAVDTPGGNSDQPQFLVRLVSDNAAIQNHGITRLSLRRDAEQPDRWHLLTQLKNYSDAKADVVLKLSVNGQPLGQRAVALSPKELVNAENEFVWDKGGFLQAEISPADALAADNRAIVNLPSFRTVHVALFAGANSQFATDLRTVLSSNPYVETQIVLPGASADASPDVAIYQGKTLPAQFEFDSIFFLGGPSESGSRPVRITDWNSQHPATRWVRTHDVSVRNPATLAVLPGDTVLAKTEGTPPAPLILAREQNGHRVLVVGFDPHESNFPLESAFPLLMAGAMEWMTHSVDEVADSLSTGELDIPGPVTRIIAPSGKEVPFARKGPDVHLLATETGLYRIVAPGGESSVAINPPLLPAQRITATPARGGRHRKRTAPNRQLGSMAIAGAAVSRRAMARVVALLHVTRAPANRRGSGSARQSAVAKIGAGVG